MSTANPRACPRHRPRPRHRPAETGFTLIEVLLVIVIIAVLAGLLLPAIGSATRRAREASVNAEINQLAQALADFKSRYGDYPPSRILLVESGDYSSFLSGSSTFMLAPTYPQGAQVGTGTTGDITTAQLAQRSVVALRKFWPRLSLNTVSGGSVNLPLNAYYDFNGNGQNDALPANGPTAWVLDGRACLTFFLGGIPTQFTQNGLTVYGVTGFARNPQNPFLNNIAGNAMYSSNRSAPLFEFKSERLFPLGSNAPNIIGYLDANSTASSASQTNPACYAYFSSYGGAGYDPNDVNIQEMTDAGTGPVSLGFNLNFPPSSSSSPPPNPYTNTTTYGTGVTVIYQSPQSFQIISPGVDGFYGVGGQYLPDSGSPLPVDQTNSIPASDVSVRDYEADNLTNFHNGRLQ